MVTVQATARNWGNSLGVIIPKSVVDEVHLCDGDEVVLDVRRIVDLRHLKGKGRFRRATQEIKDELRKGWE